MPNSEKIVDVILMRPKTSITLDDEFFNEFKKINHSIKLLIISAYYDESLLIKCFLKGING